MPSAAIRRLQHTAFAHPFGSADDHLTDGHRLRLAGGVIVALSLNK